jgi:hypothetical protein
MLADTVDRMHGYFQQLASDAERGLTAIANAAQVCADAYRAADMASAESVNLVGFAFAHPDATARPPGLSSSLGPTLSQQPDLQPVDAARGDLVPPARVVDAGGTTYKYYPDGSRTEITKSTAPATANSGVVTTTTTRIYRPGAGELVGEQVSTFEQRADGVTVTRTTAAGMTTTVTKHPDGSARIETTVDDHTDVKELPAPPHPDQPASGADATPGADADSLGPQTSAARDLHLPSPAGA